MVTVLQREQRAERQRTKTKQTRPAARETARYVNWGREVGRRIEE